jgi:hypothetical protein
LDRFGPVYSGPVAKIPRPSGSAGRKLRDAESRPLFDFVVTNRCNFKLARSVTFRCPAASPLTEERVVHADAQSSDVFGVESTSLKLTDANLRTVLLAACALPRKSSSLSVRSRSIEARCSRERQVGKQQRASALFALNRRCHDPGGETLYNCARIYLGKLARRPRPEERLMRAPSASGCCPGESNGRCENCPPEN